MAVTGPERATVHVSDTHTDGTVPRSLPIETLSSPLRNPPQANQESLLSSTTVLETEGWKPVNGELLDIDKHMVFSNAGVTTVDTKGNKIVVPLNSCYTSLWENDPFRKITGEDTNGIPLTEAAGLPELLDIWPELLPGDEPHIIKYINAQKPRRITAEEGIRILSHVSDKPGKEPGEAGYPDAGGVLPENAHIRELNLFNTGFGRDFLFAALMTHELHPKMAENGAIWLMQNQGLVHNVNREEEPGKILHEYRTPDDPQGKVITEKVGWEFSYYGAVDSTPLWIQTIGKVQDAYRKNGADFLDVVVAIPERNGIPGHTRSVDEGLRSALGFLTERIDHSPSGLLENKRIHPKGIPIQTWIDSRDSLFHKDGTFPDPDNPIAHFEANVYAYDAFLDAYEMFQERDTAYAEDVRLRAEELRKNILEKFWVTDTEKGDYFAPGIEIIKRDDEPDELKPFEIRRSNMGHAFKSRLLKGEDVELVKKREATLRALHASDMRCARGIRTLSSEEKRFGETRYHNGNVWTWDNVWIGLGFLEHGYQYAARDLLQTNVDDIATIGMFTEHQKGSNAAVPEINTRYVEIYNVFDQMSNTIEQPGQELQLFTVTGIRRAEMELPKLQALSQPTPVELALGFMPDHKPEIEDYLLPE
jgi:hypothetical protein